MKLSLLSILLFACLFSGFSQTTKVQGIVTDSITKQPIPFVGVKVIGGRAGALTDTAGAFVLLIKPEWDTIEFSFVGYETQKHAINDLIENYIEVVLVRSIRSFDVVEIMAGVNPAFEILRKVKENRDQNNPARLEAYQCEVYNRMQFDANRLGEKFEDRKVFNKMKVVNDYVGIDSSADSKYIPILLTESISDYYFKSSPTQRKEIINASRITGVDYMQLQQFTGDLHLNVNIYENFIDSLVALIKMSLMVTPAG